jgi:hypothetical protein
MNDDAQEKKPGQEIVFESVWTDDNGTPPDVNQIIEDVRKAYEHAFQSPGKLTIRAARRNC